MLSPRKHALAEAIDVGDTPEPKERQVDRRRSVWIGGRLIAGEQSISCDVLNVSSGGVRIRSELPHTGDTGMTLEIDGHDGIAVVEAWREDDIAGLRFDAPAKAIALLMRHIETVEPSVMEQRRFPRCAVLWSACVFSGGRTLDATVLNMGAGGARIRLADLAVLDDRATVSINRFGDFAGRLAWRRGNEFGLEFLDPPERVVEKIGGILPRIRDDFERGQSQPH